MRNGIIGAILAAGLVVGGIAIAQPKTQDGLAGMPADFNRDAARTCLFPVGGWTKIDCSNAAAAQSAQLNAWSRYVVQCTDDSYLATGDEATDEADSSDGYLPEGAWLEFMTSSQVRYLSCLNINSDADCRIWECQ